MAKEKISADDKKVIAKMELHGKQFDYLSKLLEVSKTTARKADKIGKLLNTIDDLNSEINSLKYENRSKDIQIAMLKAQRSAWTSKKSKHN